MLIAYGSSGEYVEALQTQLEALGHDVGEVDGIYGDATQQAVLAIQEELEIEQDGIVDFDFMEAIGLELEEEGEREDDDEDTDGSEYQLEDSQVSENFTLHEFVRSATAARRGIDNTPTDEHYENMQRIAELLEYIREGMDAPVAISSGYRGPVLNKAIGGSSSSAHMDGRAADFRVSGHSVADTAAWIAENVVDEDGNPAFDQLIYEFDRWTHLAVAKPDREPRGMILTAHKVGGRTKYTPGLHPEFF